MKKIIFLILLSPVLLFGQPECENGVSTDPSNPTNNSRPSTTPTYDTDYFLNGFDWLQQSNGNYSPYTTSSIDNGNGSTINQMNNIMFPPSSTGYYDYLVNSLVPSLGNGWELLLVNIGKYADNSNDLQSSLHESLPYIALYNKYSGVIRLYFRFYNPNGGNAVEVSLLFDDPNNLSGQLRYYNSEDRTLDEQTKVNSVTALTHMNGSNDFNWASADFVMAYDPCVCSHPSKLKFEFKSISGSDKVVENFEYPSEQLLQLQNQMWNVYQNRDFLTSYDISSINDEQGLVFSEKLSYYLNTLEQHLTLNEQEEDVFFYAMKAIVQIENNNSIPSTFWNYYFNVPSFAAELYNMGVVVTDPLGQPTVDNEELFSLCKELFSRNLDKIMLANNFVTDEVDESPILTVGGAPSMKYTGNVSSQSVDEVSFYTPGTYGSLGTGSPTLEGIQNTPLEYPVYNEVLGVFALLKSPKVKVSKTIHDITSNSSNLDMFGVSWRHNQTNKDKRVAFFYKLHQTWSEKYQLQLAEDLSYKLNDVAGVKSYKIKAAFEIENEAEYYSNNTLYSSPDQRYCYYAFQDLNYFGNIEKSSLGSGDFVPLVSNVNSDSYNTYNNQFPLASISSLWNTNPASKMILSTKYTDINHLSAFVVGFGLKNETMSISKDSYRSTHQGDQDIIDDLVATGAYTTGAQFSAAENALLYDPYGPQVSNRTKYFSTPNSVIDNGPMNVPPQDAGHTLKLKIKLRLIVDIEFDDLNANGKNHKTTLLLTYPVDAGDISYDFNQDIDPASNGLPINIDLENMTFSGQQVDGCSLVGNKYFCKAANNINVYNTTIAPNYEVEMVAGNAIYVDGETVLTPESLLRIESLSAPYICYPMLQEVTTQNFCENDANDADLYQANRPTKRLQAYIDSVESLEPEPTTKESDIIDFMLFPNPTTETDLVNLKVEGLHKVLSINFTNLMGQEINVDFEKGGRDLFVIETKYLRPGVYFVTVNCYEGSVTKRLIVQ